jgi:hypothetical protein
MVNKKAYLKTLEAVVAIILFLIFITTIMVFNRPPQTDQIPEDIILLQKSILNKIETTPELRTALIQQDEDKINETITNSTINITVGHNFEICIDAPSSCTLQKQFPEDLTIYSDSLMIQEQGQTAILRLFLWRQLK